MPIAVRGNYRVVVADDWVVVADDCGITAQSIIIDIAMREKIMDDASISNSEFWMNGQLQYTFQIVVAIDRVFHC